MTEVKLYLTGNEIEMLKDFMDTDTDTGIDNINLRWDDELQCVLECLGKIVTAPGFDEMYWRKHLGK